MRKYTGKHPTRICTISGTFAPGISLVETNEGGKYFIRASTTGGAMPRLDADIYEYKFERAMVQYFRQDATRFYRIIDDYEVEFFEFIGISWDFSSLGMTLDDYELQCRREFVKLMARQNVLVRFKGESK